MLRFAGLLRAYSKPMILAANKMDVAPPENVKKLLELEERAGRTGERVGGDCAAHGREGGADQVQAR